MKKVNELTERELEQVTGGAGIDKIEVQVKTLSGDNDEYTIKLTDKCQELIDQYTVDKSI